MEIKQELIRKELANAIIDRLGTIQINANEIADTKAITMLSKIQAILKDETLSDFDVVDRIVTLFEEHNCACGARHDF